MKKCLKRITSLLIVLVTALIIPLCNAGADSSGRCFISVNDKVYDSGEMTTFVGGVPYVPSKVLSYFGITTSYLSDQNAAILDMNGKQLIFDFNNGICYDENKKEFPISATLYNGSVYVQSGTGRFFGLSVNTISGIGSGDVIRIKNGAQTLTDSQFIEAASQTMNARYLDYFGTPATSTPTPSPSESPDVKGAKVYLSFVGLPTMKMLDSLKSYAVQACFFLTSDDIRSDADAVRRLLGEGHTLGVYCGSTPEEDCKAAVEAAGEATFYRPTLMTSSSADANAVKDFAVKNGFAYYSPSTTIPVTSGDPSLVTLALPKTKIDSNFCIYSGENTDFILPSILSYISTNGYSAVALLETVV